MSLEKPILIITIKEPFFRSFTQEQIKAVSNAISSKLPEFKVLLLNFDCDIKLITDSEDLIKLSEVKKEDIDKVADIEPVAIKLNIKEEDIRIGEMFQSMVRRIIAKYNDL
jgi:hypothetical protein